MFEVELKFKLTGQLPLVVGRLRSLLEFYLTECEDPEVNHPNAGQRSVELELEIADDVNFRVIKKEKKEVGSHEALINAICKRSHEVFGFYFPEDHDGEPITLTAKVIMQPLPMNANAPARTYVEMMKLFEQKDDAIATS